MRPSEREFFTFYIMLSIWGSKCLQI